MNKIKVSVIIPIYNVEKYLKECLDSVVNQTLKDIEIILINDGSTDSSLSICQEYAKNDDRIIILTQKNQVPEIARNKGIELATGDYLSIIDSDDYFDLQMLEKLYQKAEDENLDITICRTQLINDKNKKISDMEYSINNEYLPNKEIFNYKDFTKFIFNFCIGWSWDKLYKREFVIENNLKFQNLRSTNDLLFVFLSLVLADRISILDDILITHRYNRKNQLSETREQAPFCFIEAIYALQKELENKNIYLEVEQSFINFVVEFCSWQTGTLNRLLAKRVKKKLKLETFKKLKIFEKQDSYFYNQVAIDFLIKLFPEKYLYKNFMEKLFSVKMCRKRKYITIFGIRIRLKLLN